MRPIILVSPSSSLLKKNKHLKLLYNVLKKYQYKVYPFSLANVFKYNCRAIWHIHWIDMFHDGRIQRLGMKNHFALISSLRIMTFFLYLVLCKICGTKILWTVHNVTAHERPNSIFERIVTKSLLKFADKVTSVSEHNKQMISEKFGFNNIGLMRQGLYEDCYPNTVSREQARQRLCLDSRSFVLLFLGAITEYKGIDIAIEAMDLLSDDSVKLLIAGRLDKTSSYGVRITELAEKNKNIFLFDNFIPDDEVQIFFKAADYTIYPYRRIDNSGSLFLTLSFSIPTIISGLGGIPEILKLNSNIAIVIDQLDKKEIARLIEQARMKKMVEPIEFAAFSEVLSWRCLEPEIIASFNELQK